MLATKCVTDFELKAYPTSLLLRALFLSSSTFFAFLWIGSKVKRKTKTERTKRLLHECIQNVYKFKTLICGFSNLILDHSCSETERRAKTATKIHSRL